MKRKAIILWILSLIFTLGIAYYQRTTGPSYPVFKTISVNGHKIKCKLLRAYGGEGDAVLSFEITDTTVTGVLTYRRYKSYDEWSEKPLFRDGKKLFAYIPHQPPAGKVMYKVSFFSGNTRYELSEEPVIIRFRGDVPAWVLIPHIIFMFTAMLMSTRTGLEALFIRRRTFSYSLFTFICLFIGGGILGPVVQKYAFDAYWTGWPYGHDLTDNKTAVALLFWLLAVIILWRKKENRILPVVAAIILLVVYLVPHSVLGSEIDHTRQQKITKQP